MSLIESHRDSRSYLREFRELRNFTGTPGEFWPKLLASLKNYTQCQQVLLLSKDLTNAEWRRQAAWPRKNLQQGADQLAAMNNVAEQSLNEEIVVETDEQASNQLLLGYHLDLGDDQPPAALVFAYERLPAGDLDELVEKLRLLADIPTFYQFARMLKQARSDVVQFADTIDLMTVLNDCDRYMSAAMTLCNEIATRHECDRVSLGWLEGAYIKVEAISHTEKFEQKMAAVQSLEAAMEESFDQDEEIIWPVPEDATYVDRDHERYAQEQSPGNLLSLPMRVDGENIAVLTLERKQQAFSPDEVRGIRLLVDQAARHLSQLKKYDRWIGSRFKAWSKEKLGEVLGVEHTFVKAIGVTLTLILAFLLFGSLSYRVEAPFILRTEAVAFVPAPIDGFVDKVHVEVGDIVHKGELMLDLDTRELVLEEAMSLADIARYSREMDKARADNQLADMRIAQALLAQSEAELAQKRYRIDNAQLKAPFDGIVVEGDLKEMLGAPVRKGDILFKVADINEMYVEIDLPERDIHEVALGQSGEIAFVSRPEYSFPIQIDEIDPAAVAKEAGNVFTIKGEVEGEPENWWRPGMSGISKVEVGDRNVLWILTHRTVEFFRLLLWW